MIDKQDKKLVIRLREDDGGAFEKLFHKYNQKLYNYCFRLIKSRQEAEGIVQQTFLKIWESRHDLNENHSFSGFIFKISQNLIYNEFRSRVNRRYYLEYLHDYVITLENTVERDFDYLELNELLQNLTQQLPERRREIFLLSRDNGLTYKEIANQLNISENTVDTQIRKVLNQFRQALRENTFPIIQILAGILICFSA